MKKQVLRPGMKKPESGRRIGSGPARLLPVFCIILLLAGCGYGAADTAAQTEETLSRERMKRGGRLIRPERMRESVPRSEAWRNSFRTGPRF